MKITWNGSPDPAFTLTADERAVLVESLKVASEAPWAKHTLAKNVEVLRRLLNTFDQINQAIEAMAKVRARDTHDAANAR